MAGTNFVKQIQDNWAIIIFLFGMAVTWGSFTQRINTIESKQGILEVKVQTNNDNLEEVKQGLVRIETTLEFIKERVK